MTIKLCVPCRVIVFAPCLSMQESVAGGRQCVAVSLELVGSLVESYQHGLGDVSSRLYLYSSCVREVTSCSLSQLVGGI